MLTCSLNRFSVHKAGNEPHDYEDAFAPKLNGQIQSDSISVAVSDGAGETSFAREWAKMLARAYVRERFTNIETLRNETDILAKRWHTFVNRRPLPWFAEEKVRLGAFATLLGVQCGSSSSGSHESGQCSAIAIGDSCLFQVRNDALVSSFPLQHSTEFGNNPILLSSNPARNSQVWANVRLQSAEWKIGDAFFLATDALACWFLSEHERKERPWNILLGFTEDSNPYELFKAWADKLRLSSEMKNDDVTLLMLRV